MSIDSNKFSKEAKMALKIGSDISSSGLVWRKQPDGTGIWRFDFTLNGNRCRGTIGPEGSGVNLSAAKRIFENARKQAFLINLNRNKTLVMAIKHLKKSYVQI